METRVQLARETKPSRAEAKTIRFHSLFIYSSISSSFETIDLLEERAVMIDSYADLIANATQATDLAKWGNAASPRIGDSKWKKEKGKEKRKGFIDRFGRKEDKQGLIWGNGIKLILEICINARWAFEKYPPRLLFVITSIGNIERDSITASLLYRNSARNDFSPFYASISNALVSTSCIS